MGVIPGRLICLQETPWGPGELLQLPAEPVCTAEPFPLLTAANEDLFLHTLENTEFSYLLSVSPTGGNGPLVFFPLPPTVFSTLLKYNWSTLNCTLKFFKIYFSVTFAMQY